MKENASVFTPGVRLNRAVRDFSCIPGSLLGWYEATFQKGERIQPPSPLDTGKVMPISARVFRAVITEKTGMLIFEKLLAYPENPAVRVFYCGVVLLASNKLIDLATKRQIAIVSSTNCEVIRVNNGWLIGSIENREATFIYVNECNLLSETLQFRVQAHQLLGYENRMFAVGNSGLIEIKSKFFGERFIALAGQTWGIIVNSTKWFSGIGVLDAMGAKFIIAPFGENAVAQIRTRELDGIQIVTAKAGIRFASFIALDKKGDYRKIELAFDNEYRAYKTWIGAVDSSELNLAILPKGVCATIVKDGELNIFVPVNGNITKVEDNQIATNMLLSNWGNRVIYIRNGEIWSIRTK
ncbi:MAG: hypothetical protein HYW34_00190 [Candidatus Brennerbacteria bacterium]|nr:hypothetical protein [Candidatus Brennerbacteria bacterium]